MTTARSAAPFSELEEVVVANPDDGVRLHVRVGGEGPPVLLLHGFPDSGQCWRHQVGPLIEAGHRVVVPDLRGFGQSDRPDAVTAYGMRSLIGDAAAILTHLRLRRVAVVGHDWGAALSWQLAKWMPGQVERLAALSVGHGGAFPGIDQYQRSWYMLWFLAAGAAESVLPANDWAFFRQWGWGGAAPGTDPDCDRQVADLSRPGALTAGLNLYRANISAERMVRPAGHGPGPAPDVHCPTLGIWSSRDEFLTRRQMTESAAFVDGGWQYAEIDADHWIPHHAAGPLNRLLIDFLR